MPNRISSNDLIAGKLAEYQFGLISRRWQYFATYLVTIGLLFNVQGGLDLTKPEDVLLATLVSFGSIATAIVFLQLVSLATQRLEKSQIALKKMGISIVDFPLDGKIHSLRSETVMLYLAFIILPLGWFYLLYRTNIILCAILAVVFVVNLFSLNWRTKKIP